MRITKLRLKNYKGIKDGIGKNEITIDLNTDKKNKVVMLFGKNGSGKTVILTNMHPLWGGRDDRRDPVLEGLEGEKEVWFEDSDKQFRALHIFDEPKRKLKSFLFMNDENGNEISLNDKGNVTEFNSLIEEHIGLTDDFFMVGRIGSDMEGFIDASPGDRKKFVNKLMPSIDPYITAFKNVSGRITSIKKSITSITSDMETLGDRETLGIDLKANEAQLAKVRAELVKVNEALGGKTANLETLDPDGKYRNGVINPHTKQEADLREQLRTSGVFDFFESVEEIQEITVLEIQHQLFEVKEKLIHTEAAYTSAKKETVSLRERADAAQVSLDRKRLSLEPFTKSSESSVRIKELLDKKVAEFDEGEATAEQVRNAVNDVIFEKYADLNEAKLVRLKNQLDQIVIGVETALTNNSLGDSDFEVLHTMNSKGAEKYVADKRKYEDVINSLNNEETKLRNELNVLLNNLNQIEILKKRPTLCKIDECAFIKNALQFEGAESRIAVLEESIANTIEKIEEVQNSFDLLNNKLTAFWQLNTIFEKVSEDNPFFTHGNKTVWEFFLRSSMLISRDINSLFNPLMEYVQFHISFESVKASKEKLESQYTTTLFNEKQRSIIEAELAEKTVFLENILTEFKVAKVTLDSIEDPTELKETISQYEQAIVARILFEKLSIEIANEVEAGTKFVADTAQISSTLADITELRRQERFDIGTIKDLQTSFENLSYATKRYDEYETRREELINTLLPIEETQLAVNPLKGIPLVMAQNFLGGIKETINGLLNIAFNGSFYIDDFVLNEREFRIPILADSGIPKEDIKIASLGQRALTAISISLALFKQSMSHYNVLYLDEIDASLDTDNRRRFLDILKVQIDELKLEQVFIISHNDEFFAEQGIDVILLKGHSLDVKSEILMQGKNIIADYSK
jgi:DNA repair exonuclease SbcCD ATPase subunit